MRKINNRLYSWASILEENTEEQAVNAAAMPFIFPHMALMPDAHLGKGATVGSVIPTMGAIMPAAVGVDIGCGMIALKTQFTPENFPQNFTSLRNLRNDIEGAIPMSAGQNNKSLTESAWGRVEALESLAWNKSFEPDMKAGNWRLQLGTLGSGNHFIEVSTDENNQVWLFLHSGSRGIGLKIAQFHILKAQELMERYFITLPDKDLSYLIEGTEEFDRYIAQMQWAQEFALLNREEMMDRVVDRFQNWIGEEIQTQERINCHHNFTQKERHYGKDVWLSRKGAIDAHEGTPGLIPGSMGTASYVVTGKGNRLALNSSPHGAGRNFSRSAARKQFTMDNLVEQMSGIEWRHTTAFLDEHPNAYKDIDVVMADAADLVEVQHKLKQLVNVKGD